MKKIILIPYLFMFLIYGYAQESTQNIVKKTDSKITNQWEECIKGAAISLSHSYSPKASNIRYSYYDHDYIVKDDIINIGLEISWQDTYSGKRFWIEGYLSLDRDCCKAYWKNTDYSKYVDPTRIIKYLDCISGCTSLSRSMGVGRPFRRKK